MHRFRGRRNWLVLLALLPGACGSDPASKPAPAASAKPSALAARCELEATGDDGGFPDGLLPEGATVTAPGTAIADGKLPEVFAQLKDTAGSAGLNVRDTELETLDAELELEGPNGDVGLRLGLAPKCARATQVRLAG